MNKKNKMYSATIHINESNPITMIVSGQNEREVSKSFIDFFIKISKNKIFKLEIDLEEVEYINGNYQTIKELYTLSNVIKKARIEEGISQRELSRRTGVDNKTIAKIESGERKKPTILTLLKLAVGLDIEIYDILQLAGYSDDEIKVSSAYIENILMNDEIEE